MTRKKQKFIWYLFSAVLALFFLDFFGGTHFARNFLSSPLTSLRGGFSAFGAGISRALGNIGSGMGTSKEIEYLRRNNAALTEEVVALTQAAKTNKFLSESCALDLRDTFFIVPARVVGGDSALIPSYLVINRGSRDGVRYGMAVSNSNRAFVGRVKKIYESSSEIDLVNNFSMALVVTLSRSDMTGIIEKGDFSSFSVSFLDKNKKLEPEDIVITSGKDGLPPGLIVGKVGQAQTQANDVFQEVRGEFSAHFKELTDVLVIGGGE